MQLRAEDPTAEMTRSLSTALVCALVLAGCGSSGKPSASVSRQDAALKFSQCMRAHGVPSSPDPTQGTAPSSGGPTLVLQGMLFKVGPGMDPGSPAFRQSVERCGVRLPSGAPQSAG